MRLTFTVFIAAAFGQPSLPCAAQDVADFYKGKQIAILVGFTSIFWSRYWVSDDE